MSDTPRIYVACLAAYNNGKLHGGWIDLDGKSEADVLSEIQDILADSPEPNAEEWAIHDHEGFEGYPVNEFDDIGELCEIAEGIDEHGEAYAIYLSNLGSV